MSLVWVKFRRKLWMGPVLHPSQQRGLWGGPWGHTFRIHRNCAESAELTQSMKLNTWVLFTKTSGGKAAPSDLRVLPRILKLRNWTPVEWKWNDHCYPDGQISGCTGEGRKMIIPVWAMAKFGSDEIRDATQRLTWQCEGMMFLSRQVQSNSYRACPGVLTRVIKNKKSTYQLTNHR